MTEEALPTKIKDDTGNDDNDDDGVAVAENTAATTTTSSNNDKLQKFKKRLIEFYFTNEFLILILLMILLALAYPPLGAIYFFPDITATWIAVIFIFLLCGLGLKTEEFAKASNKICFNSFIFVYSFGVDSAFVFGVSRLLSYYNLINQDLADGMVITACLPLTINMCVVLTKASGGDEAAAIVNTTMWNMVGVFLSPLLILGYIGQKSGSSMNRWQIFYKLGLRVILPIVVGQILKYYVPTVANFVTKYKVYFKKAQMYTLAFIVYTIFCKTFIDETNTILVQDIVIMIVFIGLSLVILMIGAWYSSRMLFRKEIQLRIMSLYGCTHKTAAMGIPLIEAMYEGNPAIGLYTLPLLIWHPLQLIIGTFLSPRLSAWAAQQQQSSLDEENNGTVNGSDNNNSNRSSKKNSLSDDDEIACGSENNTENTNANITHVDTTTESDTVTTV